MPLSRTCRRLLIATLVVVGIAGAWCLKPRADPRLVGKWRYSEKTFLILRKSGEATLDGNTFTLSWRWWTSGDRLFIKPNPNVADELVDFARQISGNPERRVARFTFKFEDVPQPTQLERLRVEGLWSGWAPGSIARVVDGQDEVDSVDESRPGL